MEKVMSSNIDDILKSLESGIREFMDSDKYRTYLKAVSKFHDYSSNNIMLITMQKPDASLVAGYSTWKNEFKRYVRKGEKGIRIIAPIPVTVEKEKENVDEFGNVSMEKVLVTVPKFKAVTVFDVSQTEGQPLPNISPEMLTSEVKDYSGFLMALEKSSRVPVEYKDVEGEAKGYYSPLSDEIVIQRGMSQAQTVKTLVHEMAHSFLHSRMDGGAFVPQKTKEIQAESIAFSVCTHFGIDTSEYTFPYVSAWSNELDLKTIRDSMDTIRKTSSMLILEIGENYREICKERSAGELANELTGFMTRRDAMEYGTGDTSQKEVADSFRMQLMQGVVADLHTTLREYLRTETDPEERNNIMALMDKVISFEPDKENAENERKDKKWER